MRFIMLVLLLLLDEPIYISGRLSEWQEVENLPFADYPYYSRYSTDSLTKYYCIRQENLYLVGYKKLTAKKFVWNPKYLKREVLP